MKLQFVKCIFWNCKTYLSWYQTANCILYLSKLQNVFVMLMYYLCLLRGFFIHSDGKIFEEKLWGKLDYTSNKDKSQITDWIFKIQKQLCKYERQTQSKWLDTSKYNIFTEMHFQQDLKHFHEIKCIFKIFNAQFPITKTFVCLSLFFLRNVWMFFSPNQLSIQMFAAVSVLGWFSIIL